MQNELAEANVRLFSLCRELAKAVQNELAEANVRLFSLRRELAKAVQNELAEANTVAEESLSSMATVRSHAAEDSARAAYQHRLRLFYRLCVRPPNM